MTINLNRLSENVNEWIVEVSNHFDEYIKIWLKDYSQGILTKDDILNVTKKVADFKKDKYLLDNIKRMLN